MTKQEKPASRSVSRRDFLNIAAVGGGALVAVSLGSPASSAEPKKFSQKQAQYQTTPKSGQRCQNCALWQPPTACQKVDGQVSPAGWCILYVPKN